MLTSNLAKTPATTTTGALWIASDLRASAITNVHALEGVRTTAFRSDHPAVSDTLTTVTAMTDVTTDEGCYNTTTDEATTTAGESTTPTTTGTVTALAAKNVAAKTVVASKSFTAAHLVRNVQRGLLIPASAATGLVIERMSAQQTRAQMAHLFNPSGRQSPLRVVRELPTKYSDDPRE